MKSHKVNVFHFVGIIVKNPNFDFSQLGQKEQFTIANDANFYKTW